MISRNSDVHMNYLIIECTCINQIHNYSNNIEKVKKNEW